MNLGELEIKLREMGIRRDYYCLTGGLPTEAYCIENANGRWYVYYSERGQRTGLREFATEHEACEYFLSNADDLK